MGDTQNDSIRSLNFGKNGINSISDSIQTFIQLKNIGGDSMKSIIQFKCQGIINTGQTRKVVEQCPKCAQKKKKRVFNQRLKISIQYTIHFCLNSIQKIIQYYFPRILNSKDYSITFFSRKIQLKQLFKTLSLAEFNSTKYSFN